MTDPDPRSQAEKFADLARELECDDDARLRQRDYNRGRNANLAGEVFRDAANGDWQAGWLDAQDDRGLCE